MNRVTIVLIAQLVCLFGAPRWADAAAAPQKIVIAYASLNERGAGALLVARDQGFFRKYDLDVNLIYMRNAAVALSALSAGEAQFYSGSANGSVLGAIANGRFHHDISRESGRQHLLGGDGPAEPLPARVRSAAWCWTTSCRGIDC